MSSSDDDLPDLVEKGTLKVVVDHDSGKKVSDPYQSMHQKKMNDKDQQEQHHQDHAEKKPKGIAGTQFDESGREYVTLLDVVYLSDCFFMFFPHK